jgi:molybdenum cofactor cytidylyltransferase
MVITTPITAIVLAAGLSRRMGNENKLLLPFGQSTILTTTLANILSAKIGETLVVVGHEAQNVQAALTTWRDLQVAVLPNEGPLSISTWRDLKVALLTNNHYEKGMTTTIQTGVAAADAESLGYMICLSDMPFITPSEYTFLANEFLNILKTDKQAIVQPIFKEKRGNPTIFSSFYKNHILELTDTEGCKPIVKANAAHVYLVEMPTDSVLRDIDTQGDYAAFST